MEYRSKNQLVEALIREAIVRGEIQPGERLLQEELAKKLGTSATPIREALRRLEAQGIVTHETNKGVRVAEIKPEDAAEVYLIRGALESLAIEVATEKLRAEDLDRLEAIQDEIEARTGRQELQELRRLNHEFHFAIYHATKLNKLENMIAILWTMYPWDTLYVIPGRAQVSAGEHREILQALRQKAPAAAGRAMKEHIDAGCRAVLKHIAGLKGPEM